MADVGYARAIFGAGRHVWIRALSETAVVAGVSLLPLLLAAFRETLPTGGAIGDALAKAFLSGQLLFYALGLIATVVWVSNKDFPRFFPLRIVINLVCLVEVVICSLIIGFDPTLEVTDKAIVGSYSVTLFAVAVAFYILMVVIGEVHVNVGQSLAQDDAELKQSVRKSRGIK